VQGFSATVSAYRDSQFLDSNGKVQDQPNRANTPAGDLQFQVVDASNIKGNGITANNVATRCCWIQFYYVTAKDIFTDKQTGKTQSKFVPSYVGTEKSTLNPDDPGSWHLDNDGGKQRVDYEFIGIHRSSADPRDQNAPAGTEQSPYLAIADAPNIASSRGAFDVATDGIASAPPQPGFALTEVDVTQCFQDFLMCDGMPVAIVAWDNYANLDWARYLQLNSGNDIENDANLGKATTNNKGQNHADYTMAIDPGGMGTKITLNTQQADLIKNLSYPGKQGS
jgi:hypothetical protein